MLLTRSLSIVTLIALVVVPAGAQSSASGGFHTTVDGHRVQIEFNVRASGTGAGATGTLNMKTAVDLPDVDEDNQFGQKGTADLSVKLEVDCMVVSGNRASLSGVVRDATVVGYSGRTMVFAVEDGGEGVKAEPDKFAWGVYTLRTIEWFPSDAELKFDDGWTRTWVARDAEREDDKGVTIDQSRNRGTDCRSFQFAAYSLIDLPQGSGNIQVKP
jgi:hypothetical protein